MITEREEEDMQSPNWQGFLWSPRLETCSCHLLGSHSPSPPSFHPPISPPAFLCFMHQFI